MTVLVTSEPSADPSIFSSEYDAKISRVVNGLTDDDKYLPFFSRGFGSEE